MDPSNICGGKISFLEHVVLTVKLTFHKGRDLEVGMTSPKGTNVILLRRRTGPDILSLRDFPVLSLHFWRESPKGKWKIHFKGAKRTIRAGKFPSIFINYFIYHTNKPLFLLLLKFSIPTPKFKCI